MGAAEKRYPHRWKPGESGNPVGRTKLPEELRGIKALTGEEACRLISKYARMDYAEVKALLEAKAIPVLELAICKIFLEAIEKGDFMRLDFLFNRAIGKVRESAPLTDEEVTAQEIQAMSDQDLLNIVKQKLPELEKKIA